MIITIMTIISLLSVGIFGLIIGMSIGYGAGYEECLTLKMTKKQKEKYYQDKATLNQLNKYE